MNGAWKRRAIAATGAVRRDGLAGFASLVRRSLADRYRVGVGAIRALTRRAVEFGVRPHLLHRRVKHLHGPARLDYGAEEVIVISVVRNGALYVKSFLEHYQALGVAHCVFLDNGSTDSTVDMLCAFPGVTVLQADVPYGRFENTMKRYLAERFSQGRWNLCADIDELFDYPYSQTVPLQDFLRYLNLRGFTAVVTQMLDMFSETPLSAITSTPDDRLKEKYVWYDISSIDRPAYEWSTVSNPNVRMHWGGIRRLAFGTSNGLTKAALVRMDGKVKPFVEWHHATGAVVADVSCVLMHYPFIGTFCDKVRDAVDTARYGATTTEEYVAYARALADCPQLCLKRPSARRFRGVDALIDEGFLAVSEEYIRWISRMR
jgi:hypothetical protein